MTDRLQEIRARVEAANDTQRGPNERMVWVADDEYIVEDDRDRASRVFHQHAPTDIAWLMDEVETARASAERYRRQLVNIGRFDA